MISARRPSSRHLLAVSIPLILVLSSVPFPGGSAQASAFPIKHVIVVMEENHTFDNYFGTYPGANGLSSAQAQPIAAGSTTLVKPFMINTTTVVGNPCETWECAHQAYNNGKLDSFVATNKGSNLTMGYFNPKLIAYYWDYASQFVLLDNFYTSAMTNSMTNHLYLVAAQAGGVIHDARFGFLNFTSPTVRNNTFYFRSMTDVLDANHVSWRYYAGGSAFLNNWNPMPAFASLKANQTELSFNLAETDQFALDVKNGRLPSVSWVMPATDQESEHPPYNVTLGESDVVSTINAVMSSPYWNSTAIFLTWDDWGGWYDHVPPPQVDEVGYGFRVPCLIISAYARHGFIDHTQGDFTSTLKFVETLFSLPPMTTRDAAANSLIEAFDFSQPPRAPLVLPGVFMPHHYPLTFPNGTLFKGSGAPPLTVVEHTTTISASRTTQTVTSTLPASTFTTSIPAGTVTSTVGSTSLSPDAAYAGFLVAAFAVGGLVVFIATRRTART